MITFTQLTNESMAAMGLASNDPYKTIVKRNLNNGLKKFKSPAMQYFTRKEVTADLVSLQQYYTLPADAIRIRNLRVNNGSLVFPIPAVESENEWNALNIIPQFAIFYPQRWFVRGPNEVGVWPVPSSNIPAALIVAYDSRAEDMYLDDTVGIAITTTQGQTTIAGSGFNPNMVGMKLGFTDGSDGNWYSIVGYTNPTTMTLENNYPKTSQAANTNTIIASCPDIPEEYHQALESYACYMYFKYKRINAQAANDHLNDFMEQREEYLGTFADKDTSQIISPRTNFLAYNPLLVPPINLGH
jgi:hypothetical protein